MEFNRRTFLLGSAAAISLTGCATTAARKNSAATVIPPRKLKQGEKFRLAMIGCGIQMRTALVPQFLNKSYAPNCEIVAVCDCDQKRREATAKQVNNAQKNTSCKAVADFRDILADPTIDAVCIATPDHWHAYMSVEAMKHGKDVYCEKPLTFSPEEAKLVLEAQKRYARVFQTGSMQRSWAEFRTACTIVRNGLIGNVLYVDANYGIGGQKLGGPSHPVRFWDDPRNAAKEGKPNPDVDWDMWLGPAKWRPYTDQFAPRGVHNFYPMFWRFDDDIGTGYNGDWGAHHLDIAQWGLDLDHSGPYKIIRSEEPYSANPFHGGRRQFGMKMLFRKPYGDVELYHGPFGVWGTVFYGTNGIVAVNRGKIAVWQGTGLVKPTAEVRKALQDGSFMIDKRVACSIGKDYGTDALVKKDNNLSSALAKLEERFGLSKAKVRLYFSKNQVQNFCDCLGSREATISPAEVGARGAVLCQLCNLSYVYDTGFEWDPERFEFANGTGDPAWLKRVACRKGWEVKL